jgi:hypothetical protein
MSQIIPKNGHVTLTFENELNFIFRGKIVSFIKRSIISQLYLRSDSVY